MALCRVARRLGAVARALAATHTPLRPAAAAAEPPPPLSAPAAESDEAKLAEQFYRLDLEGYLVIDDVLSKEEVRAINDILDQRGCEPGVPEVYERGPEGGPDAPWSGSPLRFGSAGGGAPACPGFLNWGQPFVDLLLHPRIVPFLAEFVDSSGYGVRLDR